MPRGDVRAEWLVEETHVPRSPGGKAGMFQELRKAGGAGMSCGTGRAAGDEFAEGHLQGWVLDLNVHEE